VGRTVAEHVEVNERLTSAITNTCNKECKKDLDQLFGLLDCVFR
jgi:hypothetical protein